MKALILIDMQMEMQRRIEAGRDCFGPDAPVRIAELCRSFREKGWPVAHVRHCDTEAGSPFHPDAQGFRPMACAVSLEDEPIFLKRTSSAFASTDLEAHLRKLGVTDLVVAGAVAGFCIDSTVRAGADLGFTMIVARDAVIGFDLPSAGLSARTIFEVTMAHIESDFAKVVESSSIQAG